MNPGWRFLCALPAGFVLAFVVMLSAFFLNLGVPTNMSRWAFEINEKKHSLAVQRASPKVLIVGGSSALFGISAKEIERQCGRPVVNLGTHASLGMAYMLHRVRQVAKPGDVVLLAFEYELFTSGRLDQGFADDLMLDYVIARDPAFFHGLSRVEKWNAFMLVPAKRLTTGLKMRWRSRRALNWETYSVSKLNEWGDQVGHTVAARPISTNAIIEHVVGANYAVPQRVPAFAVVADFCEWARLRGIRVVATFPAFCGRPDIQNRGHVKLAETFTKFYSQFNVPVAGDVLETLLPPDQFFDTSYHLTEEAALERTRKLAIHLLPLLN